MAHGQPVLAGLELSHHAGVGGAATVVVPCHDRAGVGRPMQREHGVAGTLGAFPASGEVGQAIKLVIDGSANLTAHLTTVSQPGVPLSGTAEHVPAPAGRQGGWLGSMES
jgi:hypothetical protein